MPRPSADGPGAPPEARARGGAQSNGRPYLAQSNGRPYLARPQAERARTPPAQEERAAMAAARQRCFLASVRSSILHMYMDIANPVNLNRCSV